MRTDSTEEQWDPEDDTAPPITLGRLEDLRAMQLALKCFPSGSNVLSLDRKSKGFVIGATPDGFLNVQWTEGAKNGRAEACAIFEVTQCTE